MRTSKVALDTARIMNALSGRSRRTRNRDAAFELGGNPLGLASATDTVGGVDEVIAGHADSKLAPVLGRKRKRTTSDIANATEEVETKPLQSPSSPANIKGKKTPKAKRQPAKKIVDAKGTVHVQPPPNWLQIYELTGEMRKLWPAPVDTMGCESLADVQQSPRDQRLQTLVALMLSSQTKDTVTAVAIQNLQENLPGGLNLEALLEADAELLNSLISKVGFHNNKTKYIKATAELLRDKWHSDIPDTIDGLISLPGVGPKMAYLCMSAAWGRDEGIGVDVHVHRITNLWGWHKTRNPEETRAALESWLPKEKWHDINSLLVGFGQTWCPPIGRKCDSCKLAEKSLCPSAVVSRTVKQKVKREVTAVQIDDGSQRVKTEFDMNIDISAVKAEDLADSALDVVANHDAGPQDIEDFGRTRRSRRLD